MITLAHPWLLILLPLPLLVWWLAPAVVRGQPAVRVPFFRRVSLSMPSAPAGDRKTGRSLVAIRSAAWILIILALTRPQRTEPPIEKTEPTRDLLLLVDLSASMVKEDFTDAAGNPVDRLTAVKEVVGEFLLRREGDRVGLVVFGASPFLQVPFTTDLDLCRQLLDQTAIGMAGPQTALGDAIGLGINLFEESELEEKTIIALTDGNDTSSQVPPVEAARVARDRGIRIHTVAIGDPQTVGEEKLDEITLKGMSEETGGAFFLAMNRSELESIYTELDKVETTRIAKVTHQPRTDLFFLPLAMALLLSLGAGILGSLRIRVSRRRSPTARVRVNTHTFELEIESG